ncbi:MAG TPA: protein phosphatase 2C domain-containing protein [Kofleriaceae bacterium]
MAARASIVGACETSVGKVREHNEDSHFLDVNRGIFAVCDGMGGHAAGEVASALAIRVIRDHWSSVEIEEATDNWLDLGTPEARKHLLATVQDGVVAAHDEIVGEAQRDKSKHGMGTTIVGALIVGGDIVFAQCGDSRAYIVRDNIAMQLTEDHTLLARLLAAGVDVDTSNEGARFKSMLTNALGIGHECKAATFIVPLATGDRFLLCSDGITEYVQEAEIGEVLSQQPSPARAAQKLVELALARGGADNATALVVKVVEAGETARPAAQLQADDKTIASCALLDKCTPQGRLRALRIALPREYAPGERIPAQTLGDRVAWIVLEGEVELEHGAVMGPGGLLYPQALAPSRALPDKHGLGVAMNDVRVLALRADDFRELCADDTELGEQLTDALERLVGDAPAESPSTRAETIPAGEQVEPAARNTELGMGVVATADSAVPSVVTDKPEPPHVRTRQSDPGMAATLPPLPHVTAPRPTARSRPDSTGPTLPDGLTGARARAADKTDKSIERAVTPPIGLAQVSASATLKPTLNDQERDALARGPTDPKIAVPRTATAKQPALTRPPAEPRPVLSADAEANIDQAFADLTDDKPRAPRESSRRLRPPTGPHDLEAGDEITIEAEPPPPPPRPPPDRTRTRHTRPTIRIDDDEPEISIVADPAPDEVERTVEIEVDAPMGEGMQLPARAVTADEESSPEVLIIQTNRPITANDAKHVAGTIDTPKRSS